MSSEVDWCSIAWIRDYMAWMASIQPILADFSGEELLYEELKQKTSDFEKNARASFGANPRFINQFFEPTDFSYDVALCKALLSTLQTGFEAATDRILTYSVPTVFRGALVSPTSMNKMKLYIGFYQELFKALRFLATQASLRKGLGNLVSFPALFNSPLELLIQLFSVRNSLDNEFLLLIVGFVRSALQFGHNFAIHGSDAFAVVWPLLIPKWVFTLRFLANEKLILEPLCALISSTCTKSPEKIIDIMNSSAAVSTIITYYIDYYEFSKGQMNTDLEHWFSLIFQKMWPYTGVLLSTLAGPNPQEVSKYQLFTLHMIESNLEQWIKANPNQPASQVFGTSVLKTTVSLFEEITKFEDILIRLAQNGPLTPITPLTDQEKQAAEYGWLALQVVASISAALNSSDKAAPESIQIVQKSVRLLGLGQAKVDPAILSSTTGVHRIAPPTDSFMLGLKTILIRILANYSFECRIIQDEIRTAQGIPLVLNGCKDDPFNPFIREWSLFACRNLCDDNEDNQQLIASFKVSGVMPSLELEQMGFRAVMEETGKVRVEKVDTSPSST